FIKLRLAPPVFFRVAVQHHRRDGVPAGRRGEGRDPGQLLGQQKAQQFQPQGAASAPRQQRQALQRLQFPVVEAAGGVDRQMVDGAVVVFVGGQEKRVA